MKTQKLKKLLLIGILQILILSLSFCNPFDAQSTNCGNTFTETDSAATGFYDYSVTLSPGCITTINGVGGAATSDYFIINTGTSSSVTLTCTWVTGADSINLSVQDLGFTNLASFATATVDSETGIWTPASSYTSAYIIVNNLALANYKLVIQGN
ncbi:MAG: hypothetical protein OEV44_04045 [Spirochaetota bacterium]|nr:hypothetical protein [Spirochaetota bacterium]